MLVLWYLYPLFQRLHELQLFIQQPETDQLTENANRGITGQPVQTNLASSAAGAAGALAGWAISSLGKKACSIIVRLSTRYVVHSCYISLPAENWKQTLGAQKDLYLPVWYLLPSR